MAYEYHQLDGNTATAGSAITAFGVNTITTSTGVASPAVGDILQVSGSTSNDGYYTITSIAGAVYGVVPNPNPEAAAGNAARVNRNFAKGGTDNITAYPAAAQVQCATATFQTDNVQKNDRVIIQGTAGPQGGAGNNGAFWVDSVVSQTTLAVRPLNGEAALNVGIPIAGTVQIRQGGHRIIVTDQAGPFDFADIANNMVPLTQQAPGTSDFASGVAGDFASVETFKNGTRDLVEFLGIHYILLYSPTTAMVFRSLNEIAVFKNWLGPTGGGNFAHTTLGTFPVQTITTEFGGDAGGGDRYTADDGSAIINLLAEVQGYVEMRGCYWDGAGAFSVPGNQSGFLGSSIIRPTLQAQAGSTVDHETIIVFDAGGVYTLTGGVTYRNLSIAQQTTLAYLANFGPVVVIPIEGVLIGDQTLAGIWGLFNVEVNVLNPRADYPNSILWGTILSGGIGRKTYTWNPTCLERDYTGAEDPEPIEDLWIEIQTLYLGSPIAIVIYQTDSNGRISGVETDRDGVNLIRTYKDQTFDLGFTHRIIIEKAGYRAQNFEIEIAQELNYDHFIDAMRPDYQGGIPS